jgi:hypothetical protein
VSPTSLTFASATVGVASAPQTITVTNSGSLALTVSSVTVTGTNASSFSETNTCSTVAIGGTCSIVVTFKPATFGNLTAAISIADNVTGSPQTVTLSGSATEAGSFGLTASAVTVTHGSSGTSTITATPDVGTITLTCSLATSPSGASNLPTCTPGSAITIASGAATATSSVTINTTGGSASLARPQEGKGISSLALAGAGGIVVAGLLFFGIPARRRAWRSMLTLLVVLGGIGIVSGCGGGSKKSSGTTAGAYTFTVTGTDGANKTSTTTVNVTVN